MSRSISLMLAVLVTVSLVASSVSAQSLLSYDHHAVGQEMAKVSCPGAPFLSGTAPALNAGPTAWQWWLGGVAADNGPSQFIYWANGHPADGIQRLTEADLASGATPDVFPLPVGFNQLSGMCIDPNFGSGRVLWATDGFDLYQVRMSNIPGLPPLTLQGPFSIPFGATCGNRATGLAYNSITSRVAIVDNASCIRRFDTVALTFGGGVAPAVAVPPQATGIAYCRDMPGSEPFVSYTNGTVMKPANGMSRTLPSGLLGMPRRHHGLTFLASPLNLGGAGTLSAPKVDFIGDPVVDNPGFTVVAEKDTTPSLLYVALGFRLNTPINYGPLGEFHIQPATMLFFGPVPSGFQIPLPLVGIPAGITVVAQAFETGPMGAGFSNAWLMTTSIR